MKQRKLNWIVDIWGITDQIAPSTKDGFEEVGEWGRACGSYALGRERGDVCKNAVMNMLGG